MKRRLLMIVSLLAFVFILASCGSKTFTVTFESNGGSTVEAITVKKDEKVTKPADPTKAGYNFSGWYKEESLTTEWKFETDTVTANITLYGKWTAKPVEIENVKVTFNYNYSGGTAPKVVEVKKGDKVTKPTDPIRPDHEFKGWFKEAAGTTAWNFAVDTVTGNLTLYAKWETVLETVSVTINFDPQSAGESKVLTVVKGEAINFDLIDIPVVDGYDFTGWFVGDTEFDTASLVQTDMTITGKFTQRDSEFVGYIAITTPEELIEIMTGKISADKKYFLSTDINMAGVTVTHATDAEFSGILNGNGKTISNLTYSGAGRLGLFRTLKGATVTNLTLKGFDIASSNERAGALAGEITTSDKTTIKNVNIIDSKVAAAHNNGAGGLVGFIQGSAEIDNIRVTNVSVSNKNQAIGGLVGLMNGAKDSEQYSHSFSNIFITGKIEGPTRVGGLFGGSSNLTNTTIENVVLDVKISGTESIGAFIGKGDKSSTSLTLKNSFVKATYDTKATSNIGYFSGDNNPIVRENAYVYIDFDGAFTRNNSITDSELITNIHKVYDLAWWDNISAIKDSELWEANTDLGIYVLKGADVSLLEKPNHFVVTLDYGYNELKKEISVLPDAKLAEFADPTRTDYVFLGWLLGETLYNFETPVTENITLVASWADSVSADLELTFANDRLTLGITLGTEYDLSVEGNNIEVAYFTEANGEFVPVLNEKTNEPLVKDKSWAGFLVGSDGTKYSKGTVGAFDYDETHLDMLPANIWLGTQLRNGLSSDGSDMSYHGINWGLSYMFKVVVKITTPDKVFEFDVVYEHKPTHVVEIMDGLETLQQVPVFGGEILPELDLNTSDKVVEGLFLDPEFANEFELDTVLDKDLTLYVKWAVAINADLDVEYANGRLTFGFELDTDFNFEAEGYQLEVQYFTQVEGDNVPLVNSVEEGIPLVKNKAWAGFLVGKDGTKYSKGTVGASDYNEDYLGTIPANTWVGTQLRNGASSDGSSMDYHNINWNHAYIFVIELRLVTPKLTYTFDITYNHEPKFNVTVMDGENTLDVIEVLGGSLLDVTKITNNGLWLVGLYLDEQLTIEYDNNTIIQENLTLYSKWDTKVLVGTAISTGAEFINMLTTNAIGEKYYLANDIIFDGVENIWIDGKYNLRAELDGNFKQVSGIVVADADRNAIFYETFEGAVIKNITFSNIEVKTGNVAAILIAQVSGKTIISNVRIVDSNVEGSQNNGTGVLIGRVNGSELSVENIIIMNSSAKNQAKNTGLIIGRTESGSNITIKNIYLEKSSVTALAAANDAGAGIIIGYITDKAQNISISNVVGKEINAYGQAQGIIGYYRGHVANLELTDVYIQGSFNNASRAGLFHLNVETRPEMDLSKVFLNITGEKTHKTMASLSEAVVVSTEDVISIWWQENLPSIANSNLWEFDANTNFYVLK